MDYNFFVTTEGKIIARGVLHFLETSNDDGTFSDYEFDFEKVGASILNEGIFGKILFSMLGDLAVQFEGNIDNLEGVPFFSSSKVRVQNIAKTKESNCGFFFYKKDEFQDIPEEELKEHFLKGDIKEISKKLKFAGEGEDFSKGIPEKEKNVESKGFESAYMLKYQENIEEKDLKLIGNWKDALDCRHNRPRQIYVVEGGKVFYVKNVNFFLDNRGDNVKYYHNGK